MKKHYVIFFTLSGLFFATAPLVLYLFQFSPNISLPDYLSERLSFKNDDWGSFGSFLSGTSGAIFSFFGTLAVIWTLIETHRSNEKQINMIRSEQTFSHFNQLLNVLVEMLQNKNFPLFNKEITGFEEFKNHAYSKIALKLNMHLLRNPEARRANGDYDFVFYATFHDKFLKEYDEKLFKKEAAIYTVLLERIINADYSIKEALIAVLNAKLNEDYFFFLNASQLSVNDMSRITRIAVSSLPLLVPTGLSDHVQKSFG